MTYVGGRRRPHAAERSYSVLKSNAAHLTAAEILVGIFNMACEEGLSDRVLRKKLSEQMDFLAYAIPEIADDQIAEVRKAWRAAKENWEKLPVGGEMEVVWPWRKAGP